MSSTPMTPRQILASAGIALVASCLIASAVWASGKTLTIKGYNDDPGSTIVLDPEATVGVTVNEQGIVIEMPSMDIRLRCSGDATAEGYCYLSASAGGKDSDGDGVPDSVDECPGTGSSSYVDNAGCAQVQADDDGDGVPNVDDNCPNTAASASVDGDGCSEDQLFQDADSDGVANSADECPNTPTGAEVDANGCAASQKDTDGDGVTDDLDQCPNTAPGTSVGNDGCAVVSGDYCANTPTTGVTCNASDNLDPWWAGEGQREITIPARRTLAFPFTPRANSVDAGVLTFTSYQEVLTNHGWFSWFSLTPGGPALDTSGACQKALFQARGNQLFSQDPAKSGDTNTCYIGNTARVMYLNYAVKNATTGATDYGSTYKFYVTRSINVPRIR
jgi:hypothetical protein